MFTPRGARAGASTAPGPAGATGRARAWCPSSRRRTWAAGACGRWSRCAPCWRSPAPPACDPPRRRAADERRGGQRRRRGRLGGRVRQRVAGLHQGPRRPGRRLPGRLGRLHRGGVALEADARRRHAPVGHRRRGGPLRARPPRRAPGRRPRPRHAAGRGARRSCPGVELDPATVETNIVIFAVPDAAAFTAALAAEDVADEPLRAHARARRDAPRRRRTRGSTGRSPPPRGEPRRMRAWRMAVAFSTCPLCEATCGLEITSTAAR